MQNQIFNYYQILIYIYTYITYFCYSIIFTNAVIKKNNSLAFNTNLIDQSHNKQALFQQYPINDSNSLINIFNSYNHFNYIYVKKRIISMRCLHIQYIKSLQQSSIFKRIKYLTFSIKKTNYIILYLEIHPIIKKIDIHNYKNLKIPKKKLIKYLYLQLGSTINYKILDNSLYHIYQWYIRNGFKYVRIKYSYNPVKKTVHFEINEGQLEKIYFFRRLNIDYEDRQKQYDKLNGILKKDFFYLNGKTLNCHVLEKKIHLIKIQYFLHDVKYYVKYKSNSIIIIILYSQLNQNYFLSHINCLKIQFKKIKMHDPNSSCKQYVNLMYLLQQQYTILYQPYYKYFILNLISTKIKYFKHIVIVNQYRYTYLFDAILKNPSKYSAEIILILFFSLYKNNILNNNILYRNYYCFLPYYFSKEDFYFEIIWNKNLDINYFLRLHFCKHYQRYINISLYKISKKLKKYNKISNINYVQSSLQYHQFPIVTININHIKYLLNIYYDLYVYNNKILLKNLYKYKLCLHNIKIAYKIFNSSHDLPDHNFKKQIIVLMKIDLLVGYFNKYLFFIKDIHEQLNIYFLNQKCNILLDLEYQILSCTYYYVYIFFTYSPVYHKCILNTLSSQYYELSHIKLGSGIQINIPFIYIPIIRIESKIIYYNTFNIYIYLKFKSNN